MLPLEDKATIEGNPDRELDLLSGVPPTVRPASAMHRISWRWGDLGSALLYMSPALLVFAAFTFIPFFRSIWLSFFVTDQTGAPSRFNDVKYYARILNLDGSGRDEYLNSILTTVKFTLMVVPTGIAVAVGLAVLATAKVRGMSVFRTIFTSTVAISVASASVIWALIYNPSLKMTGWVVDLLDLKTQGVLLDPATALPAVAFMTVWTSLGFNFIITLAGLQAIPQDLYDSSRIDGANGWQLFRFITLPLLTPTLLFLLIISTIAAFQAFTQFNVLIANEGPDESTNVMVYALFHAFFKDNRYGFASALAVVLFVVLLVLSIIQFRLLDRRVHYQ
ncbi:MAG: sugar ABC transporter permease [Chloroflexota bacterium]|nr:sugar ABC transporter permease [Chloroflexota bacterium]